MLIFRAVLTQLVPIRRQIRASVLLNGGARGEGGEGSSDLLFQGVCSIHDRDR